MKRQYFGTDGVRGEFGGPVINPAFAWRLGAAAGRWLRRRGASAGLVVIGRDTRASGPVLERALAAGLEAEGVSCGSLGVVPTPAVSLAVRHYGAVLGAVVTASHNPATDNGIKFFGAHGMKLDDAAELEIESLLATEAEVPAGEPAPHILRELSGEDLYVKRLVQVLPADALAGWKIVVDTANGAAHRTTPEALRRLGAEVIALADEPDGMNINVDCGSQHPEWMCHRVRDTGARIGIAHDGDADRLILSDEKGEVVDGDEILALLAAHALAAGKLRRRTLVATIQSNLGLARFMDALGGHLVQTAVGDRYVIEAMVAGGYNLGGESSGHIICTDISPCGDGLAAALLAIEAIQASGRPLSELRRALKKFPQLTKNLRVAQKPTITEVPVLIGAIRAAEKTLGADGRVLVRYSGTEPKIRLLVEGPDEAQIAGIMHGLEAAVAEGLGLA